MYNRFNELLKEHNVTAYQVGKATGISTSTLSEWKNGKYTPKMDKVQKIAEYFNVSVDYLLGNEEKTSPAAVAEDNELNKYLEELKNRKEMRMLFKLASGATKEDVEKAVAIIEALSR